MKGTIRKTGSSDNKKVQTRGIPQDITAEIPQRGGDSRGYHIMQLYQIKVRHKFFHALDHSKIEYGENI